MNKRVFKAVIIVFIIVGSGFGTFIYYKYYKPAIYNIELPHGLCVNASLPIGVATDSYRLKNNQIYRERVLSNFNLIVGEWEMKWGELENESGQYDFTRSDYLVEFAEANGMKIHGHTLIWHGDIPSRIENFNGTPAQLEQAMKEHIQTVVTRYKGRIQTWDVVNEAFDWIKENKSYGYRNTIFYRMLGKDYIAKAYQWAHEADPDAKLYYNDYELIDNPEKARFVIAELRSFINQGVPIYGVGEQSHMYIDWLDMNDVDEGIELWNEFGIPMRISELDIGINSEGLYRGYTQELAEKQEQLYYQLVKKYAGINNLTSITLWGLSDKESWLNDRYGYPEWPLLFDDKYNPKPCARGFLNALKEF